MSRGDRPREGVVASGADPEAHPNARQDQLCGVSTPPRSGSSSVNVKIKPLRLEGVLEIRPRRIGDDRGFFSETWSNRWLCGLEPLNFVQDNHSYSAAKGV